MNYWASLVAGVIALLLSAHGKAQAWDLFRAENKDVKRGNELLEHGKSEEATKAYEAAQRALPNDQGVQLNKGLGLLGAGKLPEAREAFRAATQGASPELRGKANYNLGLTFLQEADAVAKEEKLEESQKLLTESIDAFKNSLRNAPKNHDAAWNLELAKRRLVDLEHKKEKQDQEKKEQEKKDQEQKDDQQKQDQDQQKQDQDQQKQDQDQQKQDQQSQDQQKQDQQKQDQQKDPNQGQDSSKDQQNQPKPEENKQGPEQQKPPESPKGQDQAQPEPQPDPNQKALPEHMQRALDALSESDDNLQKHRARSRARQRPQRIEKDW